MQSPSFDLIKAEKTILEKYRKSLPRGRARQVDSLTGLYELLVREEEASSVYTPKEMATELFEKTIKVIPKGALILDCSSGTGNLAKPFLEAGLKVYLMDMDEAALSLAKLIYPSSEILLENFLETTGTWDVIIGNPPYRGHKSTTLKETAALKIQFPEVMDNKADLYYAFFAKAYEALTEGGILSFIVSRYWLEAESALSLRRFLLNRFRILYIHDWYGRRPFGAGVDPLLIVLKKEPASEEKHEVGERQEDLENVFAGVSPVSIEDIWIRAIDAGRDQISGKDLSEFDTQCDEDAENESVSNKGEKSTPSGHSPDYEIPVIREDRGSFIMLRSQLAESSMKLLTTDERRLRETIRNFTGSTMGEAGEFYQGIITGFDQAFIMTEAEARKRFIEKDLLVPWAKSSDLDKLEKPEGLRYLIYADQEAGNCPGFMAYIEQHKERLAQRREVQKGVRAFYELQWGRDRGVFESRRILFPYKAPDSKFVIAEGIFHSADIYSYRTDLDLNWLSIILNSPLYDSYIKTELKKLGGTLYEYYPHRLKGIRIPDPVRFPDPKNFLEAIERSLVK